MYEIKILLSLIFIIRMVYINIKELITYKVTILIKK
jgi:hypothetical protein